MPFTLLFIMPTNKRLEAIVKANKEQAVDDGDQNSRAKDEQTMKLLAKWNRLHAVRSLLGSAAFFCALAGLKGMF